MPRPTINVFLLALAGLAIAGLVITLSPQARAQDIPAGERVFKSQCGTCHSPIKGKDMAGPSMWGVLGRGGPFASVEQFEQYLENPKKVIPETTMNYPGMKNPAWRRDLIAYLSTLK
jgi:cytochrome c